MAREVPKVTRCLIVANRSVAGRKLEEHLRGMVADRGPIEFHIVVPEHRVEMYEFAWAAGFAVPVFADTRLEERARPTQVRLDGVVHRLRAVGLDVTAELGPAPPLAAIAGALDRSPYDEIVISTLPGGVSRWLRMDLPRRVQRRFGLPVTTIVHDAGDDSLVDLPPYTAEDDDTAARQSMRAAASERPIQVLVVRGEARIGRGVRAALETTGLCCVHSARTVSESIAYLHGEGSFAGRSVPDLVVIPVDDDRDATELLALSGDIERAGRALLVVSAVDADTHRELADTVHAWAFMPLGDDERANGELLEVMLVELIALEHKIDVRKR